MVVILAAGVQPLISGLLSNDRAGMIWGILTCLGCIITVIVLEKDHRNNSSSKSSNSNKGQHSQTQKNDSYGEIFPNEIKDVEQKYKLSILYLLSKIMNADATNKLCELDAVKSTIRRYYRTEYEQKQALNTFKGLLKRKATDNLEKFCRNVVKNFSESSCEAIMLELFNVAYADDNFDWNERHLLINISNYFGFSREKYEQLDVMFQQLKRQGFFESDYSTYKSDSHSSKHTNSSYNSGYNNRNSSSNRQSSSYSGSNYSGSSYGSSNGGNSHYTTNTESELNMAYKTLGVSSSNTNDQIKETYKKLIRKWHPDRFASQGDEAIRKATETSKIINQAYDTVCKSRGIN